ncbi:MAG TPA: MauE/DoxX family redox-associated membrane protein [Candidatus Limnocylindria bacterium]|nr:MauE/DoxX family redox-associated membrane protein [Candidatus Limnocylindria bacterium]
MGETAFPLVARLIVGGLLFVAGVAKLRAGRAQVRELVLGYGIGKRSASLVAIGLPPVEVAVGLALVIGVAPSPSALAGICLLLVFSAAIVIDLLRGRAHSCGCLGKRDAPIRWRLVYRNLALATALVGVSASDGHTAVISSAWLVALVALSTALVLLAHLAIRLRVGTTSQPEEQLA